MKTKKRVKKDKPIFWRNLFYEIVYRLADTPLPEIAFMSALIMARWWLNSDYSYPNELILPIIMFGLLSSSGWKVPFGLPGASLMVGFAPDMVLSLLTWFRAQLHRLLSQLRPHYPLLAGLENFKNWTPGLKFGYYRSRHVF